MALFDGGGSFGLGLGGFDISDSLGLTADLGTINYDNVMPDATAMNDIGTGISQGNFTNDGFALKDGTQISSITADGVPGASQKLDNSNFMNTTNQGIQGNNMNVDANGMALDQNGKVIGSGTYTGNGKGTGLGLMDIGKLGLGAWQLYDQKKLNDWNVKAKSTLENNKRARTDKINKQLSGNANYKSSGEDIPTHY